MPFGARHTRFWKGVAAVAVAGLAFNSYATFHLNKEQQHQRDQARDEAVQQSFTRDQQIRAGQIQNCLIIGEPIRHAQIHDAKLRVEDIKTQRQQSKHINYHDLFPNYSPKQLHKLIEQSRARQQRTVNSEQDTIEKLKGVPPCEQRYPEVLAPLPSPVP